MTRPPDYDLGTAQGIVRTVEAMRRASMYAREALYVAPFNIGGHPYNILNDGYEFATEAAHHARRLHGVAERSIIIPESGSAAQYVSDLYPPAPDGALCAECGMVGRHVLTCPESCPDCHGTGTAGERAADGAPLVCTACQGGRRP